MVLTFLEWCFEDDLRGAIASFFIGIIVVAIILLLVIGVAEATSLIQIVE